LRKLNVLLIRTRFQAVEKSSLVSPPEKNKEDDIKVSAFAVRNVFAIPGSSGGHTLEGEIHQTGSAGRLAPPFQLVLKMTALEQDRRTRSIVSGDLVGVMETFFYPGEGGGTRIVFYWYVRVHNPLLNALGKILEPSFRASNDRFMRDGEAGLQAYCQQCLLVER
jgi:hypothetical protein